MFKRMLIFMAICALAVIAVFLVKGYVDDVKAVAKDAILAAEGKVTVLEGQLSSERKAIRERQDVIKELRSSRNAVIEKLQIEEFTSGDLRVRIKNLEESLAVAGEEMTTLEGKLLATRLANEELRSVYLEKARKLIDAEALVLELQRVTKENYEQLEYWQGLYSDTFEELCQLQADLKKAKKRGLLGTIGAGIIGLIGWIL